MTGPVEIGLSRALIGRTRRRLEHQKDLVAKLGFTRQPQTDEVARGILFNMEAKLEAMIEQHDDLLRRADRPSPRETS